jgi:GT2 family glycosyltransferase
VSVIVPAHEAGDKFQRCLASIAALVPRPLEVIIAADGVAAEFGGLAEEHGFETVTLPEQGGPARARNAGAERARGGILFFVDSDVLVPADAVRQVTSAFEADPELAALFGSYDDEPLERSFLSQFKNLFHHYTHQTSSEEASTFWGACGAVRRDAFVECGGFDETYGRPAMEDIELGYRLKGAGHRIRLVKTLQVKHMKAWSARGLLATDFCDRALPWTQLILERKGLINDLNLRTADRVSAAIAYAMVALVALALLVPWALVGVPILGAALLALNAPLYRFFWRKRGGRFTAGAVAWHWFYFLYSGLAFGMGFVRHRLGRRKEHGAHATGRLSSAGKHTFDGEPT